MSRSIFDINQDILNCINEETGEFDAEAYEALAMEKAEKIDSLISWVKELTAEASAIRAEEIALAERRKAKENKAESITRYIESILDGSTFESAKNKISYRKSDALEIEDDGLLSTYLLYTDEGHAYQEAYKSSKVVYTFDKALLKKYIKSGAELPGCNLITKNNMQIK